MPEIVYPTEDAEGNDRNWNDVFPIWNNDDEHTEWQFINQILEAIAMNNRFGDKTPEQLKEYLKEEQHKYFVDLLKKNEGEPHDHKAEGFDHNSFGCTKDCEEKIPEERKEVLKERDRLFRSYGKWMFYIEEVFANLGGAFREYK